MMDELGPAFIISLGILLSGLLLGAGLLAGLYIGERGRRRDVQWYAGLDSAPHGAEARAEIDPAGGEAAAEAAARRRAEKHQIMVGLREAAKAEGKSVTEEELEEEALRIVGAL